MSDPESEQTPETRDALKNINFSLYRKCIGQFENCLNVEVKEKFKGKFCKNCDNKKQLAIMTKKSDKKKLDEIKKSSFLRPEQLEKMMLLLDKDQKTPFLKLLNQAPKPIKLNIVSPEPVVQNTEVLNSVSLENKVDL
jgi:hypothetical protein